jgi:hypothetical protein
VRYIELRRLIVEILDRKFADRRREATGGDSA